MTPVLWDNVIGDRYVERNKLGADREPHYLIHTKPEKSIPQNLRVR